VLRLSIRSKILLGFVVVLLTFGAATVYGAWAVHTLGQQLRLVALGYSNLRLELQDQQTIQANLQRRLLDPDKGPRLSDEVAVDRKLRQVRLQTTQQHVDELRRNLPIADALFLEQVQARLRALSELYTVTDALPLPSAVQGEEQAARLLQQLSSNLTNKVIEVVNAGSRYEARAGLLTVGLALMATLCSLVVLLLVQATLRPLRRLSDSAKEVARGNYRERVQADSPDEVGELGREFNAMAAALAEREERLRRSEQLAAVGKMAAQITHEIRNPLTSIGLNAELLADDFADDDSEARKIAQAIVKEVDRLTDITEQYLRFARLPEPRLEPAEVNAMLTSLHGFLQEELGRRGVTVTLALADAIPKVMADDNQLRQVLLNLIRNAAEAMAEQPPSERKLTIGSRLTGTGPHERPGIAVDIIDNGPGIPKERHRQIFEPFFTTKKGGTGLGLALSLEVISRHGGQLVLKSPLAEGRGTCFTVELPTT
jgi:signal transduction histidine kinase